MIIHCGVPGSDKLPPAHRLAANLRRDLSRAVGLYGLGDRSKVVLRTLAAGKAAYDAIGLSVPRPVNMARRVWDQILTELAKKYNERPYFGGPISSAYEQTTNESTSAVA